MIENIKKKIKNFSNFLIAYSGGLDSTVLLHQLMYIKNKYKYDLNLRAIHINHNLYCDAKDWENHCLKQCNIWKIPLIIKRIEVINNKIGIEASARIARYNIFYKTLKKKEVLLTGHHINDQCETFLLALKRGSSPLGLSSMPDIRLINNDKILLRPLLNCSYEQIKNWSIKYKLSWIQDFSNKDIKYDRNFLRNKILPKIYKRWPAFNKAVYRSASLCREQEILLNEFLYKSLKKLIQKNGCLKIDNFINISDFHRRALLKKWITLTIKIVPSYNVLMRIWKELINSRKDASPKINIDNYFISRYKKFIYLVPNLPSLKNLIIYWKLPYKKLYLPQKIGVLKISNKNINQQEIIRKPLNTEVVTIRFDYTTNISNYKKNKINKKIKKIWKKFSVPVWERSKIPIIFYNDKLISIIGMFISEDGFCKNNLGWEVKWIK